MVKILIVDDEAAAGNILRILIEKQVQVEKTIRFTTSPEEGLQIIGDWKPQLLMLDIEMPAMNGFDLLSKIKQPSLHVIFTTAYDKYAIRAIRFSALDYLLKPIDSIELMAAFERFKKAAELPEQNRARQLGNLIENLQQAPSNSFRLALSTLEGVHILDPADILYCEGVGNYTRFHLKDRQPILVSKTIKEYEELLKEQHFIRVHKSYLVNSIHIVKYEKEGLLWLRNAHSVTVSRRKKEEVNHLFASVKDNRHQ
ncbi:MAG: response regulator transcription factor [Chitinophagaceae bacterium]|nr:MAG: response regulator transcription factor [Chitinophagaceae bacterium]